MKMSENFTVEFAFENSRSEENVCTKHFWDFLTGRLTLAPFTRHSQNNSQKSALQLFSTGKIVSKRLLSFVLCRRAAFWPQDTAKQILKKKCQMNFFLRADFWNFSPLSGGTAFPPSRSAALLRGLSPEYFRAKMPCLCKTLHRGHYIRGIAGEKLAPCVFCM